MQVTFKNPKTGELKQVKIGWSWILFLWSPILGLPLFSRKLNGLGFLFLGLFAMNFICSVIGLLQVPIILFFVFLGLEIWLGIKGNEITAKNYLERGWVFSEPDSDVVRLAKGKWGLALT